MQLSGPPLARRQAVLLWVESVYVWLFVGAFFGFFCGDLEFMMEDFRFRICDCGDTNLAQALVFSPRVWRGNRKGCPYGAVGRVF